MPGSLATGILGHDCQINRIYLVIWNYSLVRPGWLKTGDLIQFWYASQYVHEFYRYWEIDGREEDKLSIPEQWPHHVGISYTEHTKRYTLTLETHNLFNQDSFDNFGVQKPGRSFHVKIKASLF